MERGGEQTRSRYRHKRVQTSWLLTVSETSGSSGLALDEGPKERVSDEESSFMVILMWLYLRSERMERMERM